MDGQSFMRIPILTLGRSALFIKPVIGFIWGLARVMGHLENDGSDQMESLLAVGH
jgi:hypothetical protein